MPQNARMIQNMIKFLTSKFYGILVAGWLISGFAVSLIIGFGIHSVVTSKAQGGLREVKTYD